MKSVLFIDDEPHILEGLRLMLRAQRRDWRMHFVNSGEAALRAVAAVPFDVVVSDLHMPGMDGCALLEQVQALSPGTVRIILSGHADAQVALRSVRVSHQYLSKPCDPENLREVIERACDLQELLQDPGLCAAIGDVDDLPVAPATYQALVAALGEEEVDIGKVSAIVEQDVGITAKILELVNSSFFGVRQEISSVAQATAYLGTKTIRDLVLSAEVFRQFPGGMLGGLSLDSEQRHSLIVSRISARLLDDKAASEQAALAGMLHDVGKLVAATKMPAEMTNVLREGAGKTAPFQSVEARVLGVGHAEIGAYLLGLWGMPYPVVEAVAHHHWPARVEGLSEFGVLVAVHVADALARECDGTPSEGRSPLDEELLERLGVHGELSEWRAIAAEEAGRDTQDGTAAA